MPVKVAVIGGSVGAAAQELARRERRRSADRREPGVGPLHADGFVMAVGGMIASAVADGSVALAHTVPGTRLCTDAGRTARLPLVTDVHGFGGSGADVTFTRPMFQGKLAAQVKPAGARRSS
jgi:electron transfer flavoprotein alpha subunit